jgi:hypothetical protein
MAISRQTQGSTEAKEKQEKKPYEPPAIIYKGIISTRAGSPAVLVGDGEENGVDPADLFGNGS